MKKIICIILLFTALGAKAQQNPVGSKLQEITASLDSFSNRVPVEKVHIHFDKPYYSLGDTIWMKAYVVNETNGLSVLSKILYVDLLDDKDSVKVSLRLPVFKGLGWGAITLTDSLLTEGTYHIRAYTNLMRNFAQIYFFDKAIRIGNALPPGGLVSFKRTNTSAFKNAVKGVPDSTGISVQFFPEGGELVNSLVSRVAFKAVSPGGLGREVYGYVLDQDNKQITTFQSEHAGMGAFVLQPAANNTYTALIKFADGSEKRFKLPAALDKGYALSVNQNEESIIVSIQASRNLLNSGEVSLVAQVNNVVQYTGKKELTGDFTTVIPKSRFPEGIVQFTLFSPQYQPVAERLVFVRNTGQHLTIKVNPDKPGYNKRDKVHLNLEVTGQDGKPVTGAFSLAITDEGKVPFNEADEKTIFSNLLLSADLKGYIEQPNYYFTDINPDKDKQLDNLLLTQGWRRFVWKDILANNLPTLAYQPEAGMGISGRIVTAKGVPVPRAKVFILVNTGNGRLIDTVTNAEGRFNFNGLAFAKGTSFNVSATDAKGKKNVKVEIDKKNSAPPAFERQDEPSATGQQAEMLAYNRPPEEPADRDFAAYIDSSRRRFDVMNKNGQANKVTNLKEVVINETKDKVKEIALKDSKNMAGPAATDFLFTFVDLDKAPTLGLFLMTHATGAHIKVDRYGKWASSDLAVIVDGTVRDKNYYNGISANQIASIEVLKNSQINNGVADKKGSIIITLKNPEVNYQKYIDEHDEQEQKALAQKKDDKQKAIALKEVTIEEKKADKVKEIALQYSKSLAGPADQVLTFVDLANCMDASIAGCLVTKLNGVRAVRNQKGVVTFNFEGAPMPVFVDGRYTPNDELNSIAFDNVAGVEVIKGARAMVFGKMAVSGAIVITLKRGGEDYQGYIDEHNAEQQKIVAQKIEEKQKAVALKEVTIEEKKADKVKEVALQDSKNLAGPGHADIVLTFVDLANCGDLGGCLLSRLPNIQVKRSTTGLEWLAFSRGNAKPMHVYVDGRELDPAAYGTIATDNIASIEVLRGGGAEALYKSGGEGIILITLKTGGVDYNKYIEEHEQEQKKVIALKEVTIKGKGNGQDANATKAEVLKLAVQHSENLAGPGNADQVLTFVDLLACQYSLLECLNGRLVGVQVKDGAFYARGFDSPMYIVVDGIGGREINSVISADVASVEVLRGGGAASLYGVHGANGVLIITTKRGDVDYNAYTIGYLKYTPPKKPQVLISYKLQEGYDLRREFYSPDYSKLLTPADMPDLRSTIYWKPNIITDENGKASVDFFNADGTGSYRVIAEGVDGMGKLGRQVFKYVVK